MEVQHTHSTPLDVLGSAPGGVSQKLSGKWGTSAEKLQQVAKDEAEGCGVRVQEGVPTLSPREKWQKAWLLWLLGVTLPEPKIRKESDKCLTRKLLRSEADLGNCGQRKRHPDHCPGIRCFCAEKNSGESLQRVLFKSISSA